MAARDRLYLYSDGLPDARNAGDESFSEARLLKAILRDRDHALAKGITALLAEVARWHGDEGSQDDISILGVEVESAVKALASDALINAAKT